MKTSFVHLRSSQHGFSLIELMIAITIGLLILAGVSTIFVGSRHTYRQLEALARIQEGARYAFELMSVDIRQAGYTGCAPKNKTYSALNGTDWFNNLASQPLFGYESGTGLPAAVAGALANTDAVRALRMDDSGDFKVTSHNGASAQFQLAANHNLQQGEILTVVPPDCGSAAVFQMTNVNNNNTVSVVVHNSGAGTPGNSTKCLGDPTGVPCASPATYPDLPPNSQVMRLSGKIYFLRNNVNNEPALYRENLVPGGAAASMAEELVEGVEDMQILYGEDTDANGNVDQYVAAGAITNWDNVKAVRINLLMRSTDNGVVNQTQSISFNGGTVNPGDRRLRKVFSNTIAVRNRF